MAARTPKQVRQWLSVYIPNWILLQFTSQIRRITSQYKTYLSEDTKSKLNFLAQDSEDLAHQIKQKYTNDKLFL